MENNISSSGSSTNSILRNCITKVSTLFRTKSSVSRSNRITKNNEILVSDNDNGDNNVTLRHQSTLHNQDSDIDKSLVAESEDVVTPLPVCNSKPFAFGNGIRPEVVEIIKHMDSKSLRLNNLTMDDRIELMKRHGKDDGDGVVFRNSNSCPSFTASGLYERRMRQNEQRIRLNFRIIEVFN